MKNPFSKYLQNRTSWQTFLGLFLGVIGIQIIALYLFYMYITQSHLRVDRQRFANQFIETVKLAQALPLSQLGWHLNDFASRGLLLRISNAPIPGTKIISTHNLAELHQVAEENYYKLHASIPLADKRWLIIRGRAEERPWFFMGFLISDLLLLIAIFILCFWSVKRLSLPAEQFVKAAKDFGRDIQSPPLALSGSPEIQSIIRAFNEMQERIRRLLNDRTQMLAAISHDLRTPITRLQLRAEYLQGTPQYEKTIADLHEMEKMIASILSFVRDSTSEARELFDMNAFLESLTHDLVDSGYSVEYHGAPRTPFSGRLSALKRAFSNLIENAVKYGRKADVFMTFVDKKIVVKILDQGPGIPESEMENVFIPFYRLDAARSLQTSGSGLGLAVARDIIIAHGGDITLLNRDPKGLTVIVTLPV